MTYVHLPACPSAPKENHCEILHSLASVGACNLILHIHIVVNWQLSKQSIHWPVSHDRTAGGLRCQAIKVTWFFKFTAGKFLVFDLSQAQL